uniref:Sugar transporter SWEET1 n=1 Tax=Setaria digitata TaxID=48799 RepID=A0A915Q6N7_9BILA
MGCWLRHGYMTNDFTNIFINAINLIVFTGYILAFAFYQPCRPDEIAADVMGSIAAAMQIISLGGQIYEIKRATSFGHTEYIPAELQFGIFCLATQWTIFGILIGNYYIAVANFAGLLVNIVTISLYFIYPPLTWKVPIIGTGPQQKKVE